MTRILFAAFLVAALGAGADDKTIDAEKVRAAQQRLADKSAPAGRDAESLRTENERLKVELAAVKRELAELRKSLGINVPPKGKPVGVDETVKAYIGSHPDLKPDVIAGLTQRRPVPGMTLEEVRLFNGTAAVFGETLDAQEVTIYGEPSYDVVVRRADGVIVKVGPMVPLGTNSNRP